MNAKALIICLIIIINERFFKNSYICLNLIIDNGFMHK